MSKPSESVLYLQNTWHGLSFWFTHPWSYSSKINLNIFISETFRYASCLLLSLDQGCQTDSTKGPEAADFCSNQSSKHNLTNQLSEHSDPLIKWVQSGELLPGWNKNLQPHGPFGSFPCLPAKILHCCRFSRTLAVAHATSLSYSRCQIVDPKFLKSLTFFVCSVYNFISPLDSHAQFHCAVLLWLTNIPLLSRT